MQQQYTCLNPKDFTTSKDNSDDIGKGGYGRVIKVYSKQLGVCAAKIMRITGARDQEHHIEIIRTEAKILAARNHEHIVRFHGVACWSNYLAMIMDFAAAKSLHHLLKNGDVTNIPWNLRLRMVSETAKAITYLHNWGHDDRTVHGDLKSMNILLNEDLRIRIADFGAAHVATQTTEETKDKFLPPNYKVHTLVFTAPEYLRNPFSGKSKATDVFSFGRVVYEIITRKFPFEIDLQNSTTSRDDLKNALMEGAQPSVEIFAAITSGFDDSEQEIFDCIKRIMRWCSNIDFRDRPHIYEVNHMANELMKNIPPSALLRSVLEVVEQMNIRHQESPEESRTTLPKKNI